MHARRRWSTRRQRRVAAAGRVPSCYVDVGDRFPFLGNGPFSLEAWISIDPNPQYGHIVSRQIRDAIAPTDGYAVLSSPAGIYFEREVANTNYATQGMSVPFQIFHHVVAVYTGAAQRLYVDGMMIPERANATGLVPITAHALIGCSIPDYNCFVGVIDEVAIYDRALPAATIQAHFAARNP